LVRRHWAKEGDKFSPGPLELKSVPGCLRGALADICREGPGLVDWAGGGNLGDLSWQQRERARWEHFRGGGSRPGTLEYMSGL
jgi:hypothetical protein